MITRFSKDLDQRVASTPPDAWRAEVETDFGENAWTMAKQTGRERLAVSGMIEELRHRPGVQIHPSAAEVGRSMLREGTLTKDEIGFALVVPPEWEDSEPYYDWDKVGEYIRAKDPEVKLDLREERLIRRNEVLDKLRSQETEITNQASFMGKVGQFVGAAPVYMADPPNIVAMAASPWTAATTASRFAQYASVAGEQLVVEAATAISVAEHMKALGQEYGSKEAAMDMAMSTVGALGLKSLFDVGGMVKDNIKRLKASGADGTIEGAKALHRLNEVDAEVRIARRSGRPLDEILDDTDRILTEAEGAKPEVSLVDEVDNPDIRAYDQEAELESDFNAVLAARGEEADDLIPISAVEVDGEIKVEYKSSKEIFSEFDDEIEKLYKARACYGL